MSTRLILIELEEPSTADGIAKAVSVHELPSVAELGRMAFEAVSRNDGYLTSEKRKEIGEAILAALRTAAPAPGKS